MEGLPPPRFPNLNDLRQEAIRRLGQQPAARPSGVDQADSQQHLHELQVHQVELEMQNEELRAMQLEREASRNRYARYYDLAPVAYFNLDPQGMIVRCNLAACRLLGYDRRYLQGRGLLPLVHKDDQPAYFGFFNGLAAASGAGPCRVRLRGKEGTTGPVRLEGSRLEDEAGHPEYLVAAIPADPPAESNASERLLREAEAVGGTGSYEMDLTTRQFRFSDNLYRLLGQEPQSFTPTLDWLNSVSHPEDAARIGQVLGQAIENREPYYYQRRVYRPDGELCYLASHGKVVCDAEGRPVRVLGTVQNITGQVRTDQLLDSINEVCFELDGNFTIRYANRRACQLWEKTPGQVTGRKMWDVHAGYWSTDISDALMKAFREGQPVQAEIWLPAGQQWLLLHASPSPAGLIVLHFDITTGKGSGGVRPESTVPEAGTDSPGGKSAEEQLRKHFTILRQSEALAGTGSWEYDVATGEFTWSEGMYRLFGLDREQPVVPEMYAAYAMEADRPVAGKIIRCLRTDPQPFEEILRIRKDGAERVLKIKGVVTRTPDGQPAKVLGVDFDITAIKAAEAQLEESRALLQAVIEAAPVAIAACRAVRDEWGRIGDFRYELVNRETERQAGNRPLTGRQYLETFPGPQAAGWFGQFVRVVEQDVPLGLEMQRTLDGVDHWYLVSAVKLGDGLVVISQEVTEPKRMAAENLALRLSQQQALLNAILDAQEEERRRISESLHNGVGQILYATKLHLERVDLFLLPGHEAQVSEALETTGKLLAEAIRETRRVSHELVPVLLHDFGLEAAINDFCKRFADLALRLTCRVTGLAGRLDPHLEVALYRIGQELILNVVKHAGAEQASLLLESRDGQLVLEVSDNGRGFRGNQAATKGRGLRTIRDRVKLLNGTLDITGDAGKGVRVAICLPLRGAV